MRKCMQFVVLVALALASVAEGQQSVVQTLRVSFVWPVPVWNHCGVLLNGTGWIPNIANGFSSCPGVTGTRCLDALAKVVYGQSYPLEMECSVVSPNPGQTPTRGPAFNYVAHTAPVGTIPVPSVNPPTHTPTPVPTGTLTPGPTSPPFILLNYGGRWMRFIPDPRATP